MEGDSYFLENLTQLFLEKWDEHFATFPLCIYLYYSFINFANLNCHL